MIYEDYRQVAISEGWFDSSYYAAKLLEQDIAMPEDGRSLFEHFTSEGFTLNISPSTKFYVAAYFKNYPDIKAANIDPLYHFLTQGKQEGRKSFSIEQPHEDKLKTIAFYLPQYHPIPENDKVWGVGFTEWTNVTKATPQYAGHKQPNLPSELGFYDLRVDEARRQQEELAKQYSIHGFCYYYYWFDGRKVLETPLELKLADKECSLPFMICWANENWTRKWDGHDEDIIIGQTHTVESDYKFIYDVMPIISDPRYIRVNGKPVLMVYRVDMLANPAETFAQWRLVAEMAGLGGLHICGVNFRIEEAEKYGLDALVEFPPHHFPASDLSKAQQLKLGSDSNFNGNIRDFEEGVDRTVIFGNKISAPIHPCVMPSWDNTPRRGKDATIYVGSSPELFAYWMAEASHRTLTNNGKLLFVNAWNEWAEGACLEPSVNCGRKYLEITANNVAAENAGKNILKDLSNFVRSVITSEKPPIVFVSHDAEWGGAQLLLLRLMEDLKKRANVNCFALLLKGGALAEEFKQKFQTFCVSDLSGAGWSEKTSLEFIAARLRRRQDVVALTNTVASGDVAAIFAGRGIDVVSYIHELPTSIEMYGAAGKMKNAVQYSKSIIAVSDFVKDSISTEYSIPPRNIEVIHVGTRQHQVAKYERKDLLEKYNITPAKHLILGCGMVHYRKGTDLFVQLAAKMVQGRDKNDYQFVWIGGDQTSEEARQWAMHDAKMLGIDDIIHFTGLISDASSFMKAADLFVLTSREDPFPLVVLEAIEQDTPILAFENSGGAQEIVSMGAGLTVPYLDVSEMALSAQTILDSEDAREIISSQNEAIRNIIGNGRSGQKHAAG
jgi:glycosyltransferase involved in cell wall biosynthesis